MQAACVRLPLAAGRALVRRRCTGKPHRELLPSKPRLTPPLLPAQAKANPDLHQKRWNPACLFFVCLICSKACLSRSIPVCAWRSCLVLWRVRSGEVSVARRPGPLSPCRRLALKARSSSVGGHSVRCLLSSRSPSSSLPECCQPLLGEQETLFAVCKWVSTEAECSCKVLADEAHPSLCHGWCSLPASWSRCA